MMTKNCLNCEKELVDNYCSGCGQKADTHRITFSNFIFHDLLHGTFHIEKGILFTAKQALTRPGKAALDYIAGKRIRYYNVFYLILIVFGLILFFQHFYDVLAPESEAVPKKVYINEASRKLDELFSQKAKIIVLLFIPITAFNGLLIFRRKKLNLSEHAIIAGMILLGMLLISLFGNLFYYLELIVPFNKTFSFIMSWFISILITLHIGYGYVNAFGNQYSKLGISWRIVLYYGLFCLELYILFLIVFGILSDWKFGRIQVSPFA